MIPRPLQDSEWGERGLILMHKEIMTQMRRFAFYVDEHRHTPTHSGDNLSTAGNWMQIIIIITLICAGYFPYIICTKTMTKCELYWTNSVFYTFIFLPFLLLNEHFV